MTEARPLLSCECVECPSHRAERERLKARVTALREAWQDVVQHAWWTGAPKLVYQVEPEAWQRLAQAIREAGGA